MTPHHNSQAWQDRQASHAWQELRERSRKLSLTEEIRTEVPCTTAQDVLSQGQDIQPESDNA